MRNKFSEEIEMPNGVSCVQDERKFIFAKGDKKIERTISIPAVIIKSDNGKIVMTAKKANKKVIATMKAWMAHLRNIFAGLQENFVYHLEICNVHFPMTVKVEGNQLVINNFLGEKEKRRAIILPGVDLKINGVKIELSSPDIEAAGQTAANIEKATLIKKRDRRVFQDGIFITAKPGAEE